MDEHTALIGWRLTIYYTGSVRTFDVSVVNAEAIFATLEAVAESREPSDDTSHIRCPILDGEAYERIYPAKIQHMTEVPIYGTPKGESNE